METQVRAPKFSVIVLLFATLAALSACGKGFKADQSSVKSFSNPKTGLDYRILLEKPDFYTRPDQAEAKAKSDKALAATVLNVRLDMDLADPSRLLIVTKVSGRAPVGFKASLKAVNAMMFTFEAISADSKFEVKGLCAESFCDHASLVLTETASSKTVQIDYARSTEYLKPEDLSKIQVPPADRALLSDVIEYHLPITRHAARIANRESGKEVVDLLIVARPQVDNSDESWDESGGDGADTTGSPETAQPAEPVEEHVIELEATSDDDESTPSPTATPQPQPNRPPSESSELKLTSNPYDVYQITIPTARLKNLTVNDPMQLVGFQIVPADQQKFYEPAFKMAVLAEAFVEQKVEIYRNACNIFVRSIMVLAGYQKGGQYNANDFGRLFDSRLQGLGNWNKRTYTKTGSASDQAVNHSSLETSLARLPESYATVAQLIRPGRHGHVAFVIKLDGVVSVIDSSLDSHGPRKTPVRADQLLNTRGRKNLNLYGIRGIVR